jgi:hypothetical protein
MNDGKARFRAFAPLGQLLAKQVFWAEQDYFKPQMLLDRLDGPVNQRARTPVAAHGIKGYSHSDLRQLVAKLINGSAFVFTAAGAKLMWHLRLVAMRATTYGRSGEEVVCSPLVGA